MRHCPDCGKPLVRYAHYCVKHAAMHRAKPDISKAREAYLAIYAHEPIDAHLLKTRLGSWGMTAKEADLAVGLCVGTTGKGIRSGTLSVKARSLLSRYLGCDLTPTSFGTCPECGKPATPGYICCAKCRAHLRGLVA